MKVKIQVCVCEEGRYEKGKPDTSSVAEPFKRAFCKEHHISIIVRKYNKEKTKQKVLLS